MRGRDQVPLSVNLVKASQQKAAYNSNLFDLSIHQFHDRLALCVDPGSLLASELAGHAGLGIGISGERAAFWCWLPAVNYVGGRFASINC